LVFKLTVYRGPEQIGLFGWAPIIGHVGDSNYVFTGGRPTFTQEQDIAGPLLKGVDWNDRWFPRARLIGAAQISANPAD